MSDSLHTSSAAVSAAEEGAADSHDTALRQRVEALSEQLGDYTRQHPLTALGIAFGAGVLVSALLRR